MKIESITSSKNPDINMIYFAYTKEDKEAGLPVVEPYAAKKSVADLFKVGEDFRVVRISA